MLDNQTGATISTVIGSGTVSIRNEGISTVTSTGVSIVAGTVSNNGSAAVIRGSGMGVVRKLSSAAPMNERRLIAVTTL